ncbi:HK97-gp10 family putative phage morphogenesis protein [Anaeroselena agilis]|uniref:HK97 gp10 family phage protein n=1 Tax=Anaeroselena agilis TaxID=3063788 RepID=A0ABU3NWH4_9FIRM|nr:HK97 gp10 family phage protein [Selenomonadales bacterium 4137-cl]
MPDVEVKVEGFSDLLRNIKAFGSAAEAGAVAAMATVTGEIAEYAQANHSFQNRTGNLEASIHPLPVEKEGEQIVGAVKAGMEYAAHVEFGTSRSAPYPYLVPAVEANKQNLLDTTAAALKRAEHVVEVRK